MMVCIHIDNTTKDNTSVVSIAVPAGTTGRVLLQALEERDEHDQHDFTLFMELVKQYVGKMAMVRPGHPATLQANVQWHMLHLELSLPQEPNCDPM